VELLNFRVLKNNTVLEEESQRLESSEFHKNKKNCPHIIHMPVKGIHSFYFVFANKFMWKFVNYIKQTN